jgi:hypothetical protein
MPLPAAAARMVLLYCQLVLLASLLLLLLTGLAVAGRLLPPAAAAPCFFAPAGEKPRLLCVLGRAAEADCCCTNCEADRLFAAAGEPAACFISCMYLQENSNSRGAK